MIDLCWHLMCVFRKSRLGEDFCWRRYFSCQLERHLYLNRHNELKTFRGIDRGLSQVPEAFFSSPASVLPDGWA